MEGGTVAFVLTAVDPDGTATTWSSPQLPAGATLDPVSGAFTWTPRYDQSGTYPLVFTASDGGIPPRSSSVTVTVHVGDPDGPICTERSTFRATWASIPRGRCSRGPGE